MFASPDLTSTTASSKDPSLPSIASTPLPRVSDDRHQFTDDEHDALDKKILEAFESELEPEKEPPWSSLLRYITDQDERLARLTLDTKGSMD
jgi:hypothetical protein